MRTFLPAGLLLMCSISPDAVAQADFVLRNARIHTMDAAQPIAEALAVKGERILAVGTSEELLAAYPSAQHLDAGGRTVVPGLIDAHAHLMGLGTSMLRADLVGARSKQEVVARLKEFERQIPQGAWLLGRGWDQNDWPEQAFPTKEDLDRHFPNRPVWLTRIDGHAGWANSAAIRSAGETLTGRAPDPEGGKILRDSTGEPTGVFVDAAMGLVERSIPERSGQERERALKLALAETARYGITGVHDAGVGLADIALFKSAIDEGWFHLRLYGMVDGRGPTLERICTEGPILGYGDRLTVRSVKYYIDGALGSRGAALLDDYSDDPGNQGLLRQSTEDFAGDVRRALDCGMQVNTHAIGDRGTRVVLDAYEQALKSARGSGGRHRIEHAQVVALEDIPRFAALGVTASMQPTHATSDMYWAEDRVGPERIRGAYAWRRFLDSGVRLAFGSDFPVENVNPLLGFYAAITRQDASGWPEGGWYPDQRLTRQEALRAFTLDAAYAAFTEDQVGSIAPGKLADFVVLSRDIMTIPPQEVLQTDVVATYLGGKPVYGGLP